MPPFIRPDRPPQPPQFVRIRYQRPGVHYRDLSYVNKGIARELLKEAKAAAEAQSTAKPSKP